MPRPFYLFESHHIQIPDADYNEKTMIMENSVIEIIELRIMNDALGVPHKNRVDFAFVGFLKSYTTLLKQNSLVMRVWPLKLVIPTSWWRDYSIISATSLKSSTRVSFSTLLRYIQHYFTLHLKSILCKSTVQSYNNNNFRNEAHQ